MSAAAAAAAENPEVVPISKGGKKKLILIGVVALLVLSLAGGGVVWWLKKRAAHAAEMAAEEDGGVKFAEKKIDLAHPPTFLPLEPFVVNLADRDADRYAQIGVTLELESPAFAEQVKVFMPAVRNAILMVIAHKSAQDLLGRAGKEDLADEIMREALKPMGLEIETPVRVREPVVGLARAEAAVPAAVASAPAIAEHVQALVSAAESATASASAPASSAVAAAPASSVAPAPMRVAAATSPHGDKDKVKPKPHGEAGPIRHVHFSSFIIQ